MTLVNQNPTEKVNNQQRKKSYKRSPDLFTYSSTAISIATELVIGSSPIVSSGW